MDTQTKITRGVPLLDIAVPKYLNMQRVPKKDTRPLFLSIFKGIRTDLIIHLENSWFGKKKHFDTWFMNLDANCDRKVLEYFGFTVEPDKLTDPNAYENAWQDRYWEIQRAEDKFDVFPFQTRMLFEFLQMAYNNCPDILMSWGMEKHLKKSKIKVYGDGTNWGKLYQYFIKRGDLTARQRIVEFTVTRHQKKEQNHD